MRYCLISYGIAIDFLDMKGTARYVSVGVRMDFKITNQLKPSESKTDSYVNSYSIMNRDISNLRMWKDLLWILVGCYGLFCI